MAKNLVAMISQDKEVNAELRQVLEDLIGADTDTMRVKKVNSEEVFHLLTGGVVAKVEDGKLTLDEYTYLTVVDKNGKTRKLIFI